MQDGVSWANALLRSNNDHQIYCQPKRLALTGSEIVLMVRKLVEDDPEKGKAPLALAVLIALIRTFPCGQESK